MSINYVIWAFLQPSHLLALVMLAGVVLTATRRAALGRRLLLIGAVALLVATYVPVDKWLMAPLEGRFPPPDGLGEVDGIILLAGSERVMTSAYYEQPHLNDHGNRMVAFILLARQHPEARLVHSGGGKRLEIDGRQASQQSVAREILTAAVRAPERIVFEPDSADTCETPARLKALLHPAPTERWVVVTSAFHMPRTIACFRAVDWQVTPYPADYKQIPQGYGLPSLGGTLRLLDLAAHEWLGLVYYRLTGRTRELFPRPNEPI